MVGLRGIWRLARKAIALNREAYSAWAQRRKRGPHPPEYWAKLPSTVFDEHRPVFVLSTGRCGTALLTRIFDRIPGVLCYHAPQPELVYSERRAYEEGREQFESYVTAIRVARFELLADAVRRGQRYVETNYRITFFAPHLRELFCGARFVHLVRHPGSFTRSGVRCGFYQGQYTDLGRIRPTEGRAAHAWPDMTPIERCAWLWNETNRFIERFKASGGKGEVITVRSEELFADPAAMQGILEHCYLPRPEPGEIESWIEDRVNQSKGGAVSDPYTRWPEERKEQVRRWVTLAEGYGYTV